MSNTQIYKINDQYSVNLDQYFDLDGLKNIYADLIEGIVKSKEYFEPIEIASQHAIFNKEHIVPTLFIRDQFSKTEEYQNLVKKGFTDQDI